MLPAEPKIFHGRESELADILKLFGQDTPRVTILGAGGMGKTSLAKAVLHSSEIRAKYQQYRFFAACDTTSSKVELMALIGAHLGLKQGRDLTRAVLQHLSNGPPCLLILDNLETLWEPVESRDEIEEFLSLLTNIESLALLVTMRGAERPAKVQWTRPFLLPLQPLAQDAARQIFIDIADDRHLIEEVDQILALTDNMPLSINLLAHLVEEEGCSKILSRWKTEKTSLISEGVDRGSNLELSISFSLTSPRITSMPGSRDLLGLLSILPDGLSDVELRQSNFPIENILGCKSALLRTALAYTDDHKQLKTLVPIREYVGKLSPPTQEMTRPLLKYFQDLLRLYIVNGGKESAVLSIDRITSNYKNIQNILRNGLQQGHPNMADSVYCTCDFNRFSRLIGLGRTLLLGDITALVLNLEDHRLKAYLATEMFRSREFHSASHPETLMAQGLQYFNHFDDPDLEGMFFPFNC
ncbi:P-loop containing nucleoside triphosphate hydrolase protein [Mycena metata]|uniref:P-loop containing nucleoside triphosphate hydrolase protein n=1 Tax=Mycena metata TaxID=1033252 RepID=A0AAD7JC11_9AGAR|nr:P-loop containing nucleoside triphosphate hydrolase protein [Mycena metata]